MLGLGLIVKCAAAGYDLSFQSSDGAATTAWGASLDGDTGSLRVFAFEIDPSNPSRHWYTLHYRGVYEVDPHGAVVCSLNPAAVVVGPETMVTGVRMDYVNRIAFTTVSSRGPHSRCFRLTSFSGG